ncbi:MAG: alpha/beta hydrolase [Halieaceae bacterium]|nr:alpha/beta hydrolase [Halieaceae bacterium]MCP5202547.1 alpha/beta hydrolase [Pseudomonadales bacterium]
MKLRPGGHDTYCYTRDREIDPAADSIVFVHGAGMDHTVWTPFARHFARHGRNVVAVDLPGHGRSAGAPLESIEEISDWLILLLDALAITRAAIVGHSLGSIVALDAAARYPERVRAIALVGTTAPMPVSQAILDAAAADAPEAFHMLTEFGFSRRHLYGGSSNPGMWMAGASLRLQQRSAPGVLHADMNACNNYDSGLQRAAQVSCPVLVVAGDGDRLTPLRGAQPLLAALPSPVVRVLRGSGHSLMSEAPNALLAALRELL